MVLGSPLQRNLPPEISHEQGMEYAADVLRAVMRTCEERNVVIAVEPLGPAEGNFLNRSADGARLCDMVASPKCRLHLDCKAMSSEPTPVPDIIRQYANRTGHFHANDPNRRGPGFGDVDFVPIFKALKESGYDRWVSVEVFDYTPDPETIAEKSIEYMRACAA